MKAKQTAKTTNHDAVASKRKPRKQDLAFNALCRAEGLDPHKLNSAESGRVVKAKKIILESVRIAWKPADDAAWKEMLTEREQRLADEIDKRSERYVTVFSGATRTALAVAGHWQQLARPDPLREKDEARQQRGQRLRERIETEGKGAT